MTVTRKVDLGSVGFGLVADTRSLQDSLRKLKAFGDTVNKLGRSTDEASQKMYAKFAQIERILTTLQARTTATTQKMKDVGVAAAEIDKVTKAYQRLQNTLIANAGTIPRHEVARGVTGLNAILQRGNRQANVQEANKFALAFRDLERAAILAVGPLSGVGARLAVLSTLFESTSAKMALTVAGATGVIASFGVLTTAAVRATIQMQQFEAILQTATGSQALVAKEFEYVSGVANRFGVNIRGLVEQYGKFATASRLSNLPLEEQRKIFEGAITAGTAMRLSSERMGLAFLALEQMTSKGVVSMEELRRQLGDLIPGSFALAAKAMGVTEAKLSSMIRNGEVLASDLLPKLAELWLKVFGPGAAAAASTLQAELEKLKNANFEMLKAFDQNIKASDAFATIVRSATGALTFFAENMNTVLASLSALAGAGGLLLLVNFFGRIIALIPLAVAGIRTLTAVVLGLGVAASATGIGALLLLLARVGAVAAGAAIGFNLLKDGMDKVVASGKIWADQTDTWIKLQKELGITNAQTHKQQLAQSAVELKAINSRIDAVRKELEVEKQADAEASNLRRRRIGFDSGGDSSRTKELRGQLDELVNIRNRIELQINDIKGLEVEPPSSGQTEEGTQWTTWIKGIEKDVRKLEDLNNQIRAIESGGSPGQNLAKGLAEAIDKLEAQPEKGRGNLNELATTLQKAGIAGKDLKEQLSALYATIESRRDVLRELEQFPAKQAEASSAIAKMFDILKAKREEVLGGDAAEFKNNEALARSLETLKGHLNDMKTDQEVINYLVRLYREEWDKTRGVELQAQEIKNLRTELQRIDSQLGDTIDRQVKRLQKMSDTVARAEELGVGTDEQRARIRESIQEQHYLIMLNRANIFSRAMQNVFQTLESDITRTFVDVLVYGESTWKQLFDSILRQLLEFIARVAVVQPILKSLFGAAYTRRGGDIGTGLLEGLLTGGFGGGGGLLGPDPSFPVDIPNWATGTNFVPEDTLAMVHRGERIIPAGATGGVGGDTYNISIQVDSGGSTSNGSANRALELGRAVEDAVKQVIVREKRPGGLLA